MDIPFKLTRKRSRAAEELREYFESVEDSSSSEGDDVGKTNTGQQAAIFKPYRAVGLVCGDLGFIYHRNRQEKQMTVSIGHAFQTYDCDNLKLIYVSTHISQKISCLAVYNDFVFTACGCDIFMWAKVHKVNFYLRLIFYRKQL